MRCCLSKTESPKQEQEAPQHHVSNKKKQCNSSDSDYVAEKDLNANDTTAWVPKSSVQFSYDTEKRRFMFKAEVVNIASNDNNNQCIVHLKLLSEQTTSIEQFQPGTYSKLYSNLEKQWYKAKLVRAEKDCDGNCLIELKTLSVCRGDDNSSSENQQPPQEQDEPIDEIKENKRVSREEMKQEVEVQTTHGQVAAQDIKLSVEQTQEIQEEKAVWDKHQRDLEDTIAKKEHHIDVLQSMIREKDQQIVLMELDKVKFRNETLKNRRTLQMQSSEIQRLSDQVVDLCQKQRRAQNM